LADKLTERTTIDAARHSELVGKLAGNLKPVRRLWPVGVRAGLWLVLEALIVAWVMLHTPNDFMLKLHRPAYPLEIVFFALAAIYSCVLALRVAIPGRVVARSDVAMPAILVIVGIALLLSQPPRTDYALNQFLRVGERCAWYTLLFGALPWAGLWWAVKRAAPTRGAAAGALIGSAALLFSFAVMRLGCPIDEPVHLIIWHLMPVVFVVVLSTLAGAAWLRLRPRVT
jgi:hypothetical protein